MANISDVTESEWLVCREPDHLLLYLLDVAPTSERKLRLFSCACVRRIWKHLYDDALRACLETCERFIEGKASAKELAEAEARASGLIQGIGDIIADHGAMAVEAVCTPNGNYRVFQAAESSADVAAEAAGNDGGIGWSVDHDNERAIQCDLIREIIGNPFRPVQLDASWATELIRTIAKRIYDEAAFDRLGFLGDALREAGCDDERILAHCRQPNGHVRGCWVIDLVLGKM